MNHTEILARTLYGEARGEFKRAGIQALEAIAHVVMNRLNQKTWFGKTVMEVCLKPQQFSCWNKCDPNYPLISSPKLNNSIFDVCKFVADEVMLGKKSDITNGADHYHNRFCRPPWSVKKDPICIIGNHLFFDLRRKS
jgi:N-acetylmuramoyl-L-alanine amidase